MDRQQLVGEFTHDPFVECEVDADRTVHARGRWRLARRVGHLRGPGWVLLTTGSPVDLDGRAGPEVDLAASLVDAHVRTGDPLTADRRTWAELSDRHPRLAHIGDWDWLWTRDAPPPHPAEHRLVELDDDRDADELDALNRAHSPTAESEPGSGRTELWIGARVEGRIVAAGALHRTPRGAPHLAGVVTAADARGQGWGSAVIALLTRRALESAGPITGICTLGMYADNDGARRVYHALGYRTSQRFSSGRMG